jgi:hypothetical protein
MRIGRKALVTGLLIAALAPASAASGKTFEPTRKTDPTPGPCKPKDCSLREAVTAANNKPGRDTVVLRPGTYELNGTINGIIPLSGRTVVRGAGMTRTTIDGNDLHGIFAALSGGGTLRDLKLFDGRANPGFPGDGGAVRADAGKTVLDSVLLDGNEGTHGGAIFVGEGAEVIIKRSVVQGSLAQFGGAIESQGQLRIERSTLVGNESYSPGEGGAIDLRPAATPTVTRIISSTIISNLGRGKGGAILADGNPYVGNPDEAEEPQLFIVNSTVAFNRSNGDAGGILGDNGALVDIENSSIGFNKANDDDTGGAVAGGLYQHSGATFNVDDSVIVNNDVGQGGSDANCSGLFSGAGNVINSPSTECTVSFTVPFNRYRTGLIASTPADNGGLTKTMAIPASSGAVGFATSCPKRDQRGKLRPKNCDSGAYEEKPKRKRR